MLLSLREPIALDVLAPAGSAARNRTRHRAVELADRGELAIEWARFSAKPVAAIGRERDNATGEARERARHPEWYRFLDESAPNHALKKLEAELYLARIAPWLATLGPDPRVLDLGGGTGRLTIPLAERGLSMTLADANPAALADAARALSDTSLDIAIGVAGADDAGRLATGSFDAVLSIEVLCYIEEPLAAMRELARLLRGGGLAIVSVEAWPGGLLAVPDLGADELAMALRDRTLHRPDDLFVRYFDRAAVERLLVGGGLEPLCITSHHHVIEGPFRAVLDEFDLARADHRQRVQALEDAAHRDPVLAPLGRAWLALARKP